MYLQTTKGEADIKMNHAEICPDNTTGTALPTAQECPGKVQIPTKREQKALARMKSIKERVRELKRMIRVMQEDDPEKNFAAISQANEELLHLKVEWKKWETERQQAASERMILLGHEKPSDDLP